MQICLPSVKLSSKCCPSGANNEKSPGQQARASEKDRADLIIPE
jgi:hypothetical protein